MTLRSIAVLYIGLLVVLPIIAISTHAFSGGLVQLWTDLRAPDVLFSIKLSFCMAFAMIAVNSVMGTLTAWVLVRYNFPGKTTINALIDLPFAIPTVVTGLMLVVLYGPASFIGKGLEKVGIEIIYAKPGIILALLFVTFPFVVRAVQPILMAMDQDMRKRRLCWVQLALQHFGGSYCLRSCRQF